MGPIVTPADSPHQKFQYNWTKADIAWDYQLSLGVTPIVELSFMPAFVAGCTLSLIHI